MVPYAPPERCERHSLVDTCDLFKLYFLYIKIPNYPLPYMRIIKKHNKIMKVPLHPRPKKNNFVGNLSHYTIHKKIKTEKPKIHIE